MWPSAASCIHTASVLRRRGPCHGTASSTHKQGDRMTDNLSQPALGQALRRERRRRGVSLRDLADQIGVSFNTLSRVENGHLPSLKHYENVVRWLGNPGVVLLEDGSSESTTPDIIAKHLYADTRLAADGAGQILAVLRDMYAKLATPEPAFAVHLRSSQTFLPDVGPRLAGVLEDMHARLVAEGK